MIIVLEGLDNAGKTSIAERLKIAYEGEGYKVGFTGEFVTPAGKLIRTLKEADDLDAITKTFLFACDRHMRLKQYSEEEFAEKIIIFDRYFQSAIAYRVAEGIDESWVKNINSIFRAADMVFYIDISAEESIRRNSSEKFDLNYDIGMLERARSAYKNLISEYGMIEIDGMDSVENIYNFIKEAVDKELERRRI